MEKQRAETTTTKHGARPQHKCQGQKAAKTAPESRGKKFPGPKDQNDQVTLDARIKAVKKCGAIQGKGRMMARNINKPHAHQFKEWKRGIPKRFLYRNRLI